MVLVPAKQTTRLRRIGGKAGLRVAVQQVLLELLVVLSMLC